MVSLNIFINIVCPKLMPSLTRKVIHGKPYYYLRECQRVDGKPKIIWTLYLGSPKNILDKLTRPEPARISLLEFGASAATFDIAQTLNVVDIIDRHVPKQGSQGPSVGQYLLLATLNRCIAPSSKAMLDSWYEKTVLRRLLPCSSSQLTSQRFWDNMDRVTEKQMQNIEHEISQMAVSQFDLTLKMLLFDATNFFTFVDSFNDRSSLPQRGHSKEGRDNLRIVGLALLVTSDGDIPLFHHTYAGNQHDTVTFQSIAEEMMHRCHQLSEGVTDITLVFDKGNNAEENLDIVDQSPFHFVGSLVPTHHADLLAIPKKKMRRLDPKKLPAVWSFRTKKQVFGVERTILCTWNRALFDAQKKTLLREIRKRNQKLEAIRTSLQKNRKKRKGKKPTVEGVQKKIQAILSGRHMKDLFKVKITGGNGLPRFSFRFQEKNWHTLCATLLGKNILFTDRHDWSDEDIVLGYRAQYHVEAAFRRMKNPHFLTFRPTFHWTDQKLRVHAFTCVLALMIVSLLRRKLYQAGISCSIVQMMSQLAGMQEVTLLYPPPPNSKKMFVRTLLSEKNEEQQALFQTLELEGVRQKSR